jgi:hypothetical protein
MSDVGTRWTERELAFSNALHRAVDEASPASSPPTATRPVAAPVDLGRRRRWALAAVPALAACVVTVLVVGIGLATRDEPTPAASTPPRLVVHDPRMLHGTWDVDLPSVSAETVTASVDASDFTVYVDGCGEALAWNAHPDGLLLLSNAYGDIRQLGGSTTACTDRADVAWAEQVRTFSFGGDGTARLADRDGDTVATFRRVGEPPLPSGPEVSVAPLPAALAAPTLAELRGRWVEPGALEHWLAFDESSMTSSPDGCNTNTAGFVLSPHGGFLLSRIQTTTAVGCEDQLPGWPAGYFERVGMDGQQLVLLDEAGGELGRLARLGADAPGGPGSVVGRAHGRWVSPGWPEEGGGLYVTVEGDALRHDYDATCRDLVGYRLAADGDVEEVLPQDLPGCSGSVPLLDRPLAGIALDGEELLLLDGDGNVIRRLWRVGP